MACIIIPLEAWSQTQVAGLAYTEWGIMEVLSEIKCIQSMAHIHYLALI